MQQYWDDNWANKYTEDGKFPSKFVVEVAGFIKDKNITNILDIGAGKGRDAAYLSVLGYDVTALDISESALGYIKEHNPKIKTICVDLANFVLDEGAYDMIFANLSLHYFDDAKTLEIFKMIKKALRKNGLFCFVCKSTDDKDYGKGEFVDENVFEYGHIRHFFSLEYSENLLAQSEFKILQMKKDSVCEPHYGSYHFIGIIAES